MDKDAKPTDELPGEPVENNRDESDRHVAENPGPVTDLREVTGSAPAVPLEVATNLLKFLKRVELRGDEAYAYVHANVFLKEQLELHQQAARKE